MNECNKQNCQSVGIKHREKKNNINCFLGCLCKQQTSVVTIGLSQGEKLS